MHKLAKSNSIGPVFASFIKWASLNISYDPSVINDAVQNKLSQYEQILQKEKILATQPLNTNVLPQKAQATLQNVSDPALKQQLMSQFTHLLPQIQQALNKKDSSLLDSLDNQIENLLDQVVAIRKQTGKEHEWTNLRGFYYLLSNISDYLTALSRPSNYDTKALNDFKNSLINESSNAKQQANALIQKIRQFINSQPLAENLTITLSPNLSEDTYGSSIIFPINFQVELNFHGNSEPPSFTLFSRENEKTTSFDFNYDVDDVLDFGDSDFFENDDQAVAYFNLINFIRTGKSPSKGDPNKFIKLYRGMSNEEFMSWLKGNPISKGKFFTDLPTTEFAQDISGQFPELFSFKVRSDAVRQTSENTYQLVKDCQMNQNKKITPI